MTQGTDALAIWHVAVILTDLASMAPMPRVDKPKLFGLLYTRYVALFEKVDPKLLELLVKAGETSLGFQNPQQQQSQSNPMAMLQGLLSGNGGAGGSGGGPDMNAMMGMMQKLQGLK